MIINDKFWQQPGLNHQLLPVKTVLLNKWHCAALLALKKPLFPDGMLKQLKENTGIYMTFKAPIMFGLLVGEQYLKT